MSQPVRLDRRHRRRQETIEEIIDVAVEVMTEFGVGGLSLGEVARRMGMRTPSLYVYFDAKSDVYDAVFARGWRSLYDAMDEVRDDAETAADLQPYLLTLAEVFLAWTLEHPIHAQLMMWRPVPGYEPSPDAYAAAVVALDGLRDALACLQQRHLLRNDVPVAHLTRTWTVLTSGVMTRQLANAPHEPFEEARFASTLPDLVAMFAAHYGKPPTARSKRGKS
jgi:AcrR family transcriptional regulator